jgi:hypothetical protein
MPTTNCSMHDGEKVKQRQGDTKVGNRNERRGRGRGILHCNKFDVHDVKKMCNCHLS